MDGVLVDVSGSYREVLWLTALTYLWTVLVAEVRLIHILLREVVFLGNKIKISLWDLPQTGLSLQETLTTDWLAKLHHRQNFHSNILL